MQQLFVLVAIAVVPASALDIAQVDAVQKEWADGILNIALKHKQGESHDYIKALADQFVDAFYAYTMGASSVLVKPATTLPNDSGPAAGFCLSRDCTIFSLIGQSSNPEEVGLAVRPWNSIRFENVGLSLHTDSAKAVGHAFFLDSSGAETKIEYSLGYVSDGAGKIRINLFHAAFVSADSSTTIANADSATQDTGSPGTVQASNSSNSTRASMEERLEQLNKEISDMEANAGVVEAEGEMAENNQSTVDNVVATGPVEVAVADVATSDVKTALGEEVAVDKVAAEESQNNQSTVDNVVATAPVEVVVADVATSDVKTAPGEEVAVEKVAAEDSPSAAATTTTTTEATTTTTTTAATTTTTTTTTTMAATTTNDWFYDRRGVDRGHVLPSVGRPTKAPTQAGGSIVPAIMLCLILVSFLVAFGITIMKQMNSRMGTSSSDTFTYGVGLLQQRMQTLTGENTSHLHSNFDKTV